jgi:asparagine synthase (glutamine-hydrolysing)
LTACSRSPSGTPSGARSCSPATGWGRSRSTTTPELTISPGGKPDIVQYWDLAFNPDHSVSEHEWVERLQAQLEASVRQRLTADVPLGFFLSGGVDSSAIVAVASRLGGTRPLKTFSLGFAESSYDERPFARAVARHCGTDHAAMSSSAAIPPFSPTAGPDGCNACRGRS